MTTEMVISKSQGQTLTEQFLSKLCDRTKEPRFIRRALSEVMLKAVADFPENINGNFRKLSCMPSFYDDKRYVFLQIQAQNMTDYENDYREKRRILLEIACGVTKNKNPHLKKVIGIAVEPPRINKTISEDFILMNCDQWSEEQKALYTEANKELKFYESPSLKMQRKKVSNFPREAVPPKREKIGRNEKCPCGSEKKYKKCHGS